MASPSWFKSRRLTEAAKKGDLEALSGILNHETVDVTDKVICACSHVCSYIYILKVIGGTSRRIGLSNCIMVLRQDMLLLWAGLLTRMIDVLIDKPTPCILGGCIGKALW